MKKILLSILMAAAMLQPVAAQTRITGEAEDAYQNRMQWFGDAKFGVFIHWGIYAVRGVSESWSFFNNYLPYEEYMKQLDGFTASKYNAKEWVDLIEQSGAQYTVITTKHHQELGCQEGCACSFHQGGEEAQEPETRFLLLAARLEPPRLS